MRAHPPAPERRQPRRDPIPGDIVVCVRQAAEIVNGLGGCADRGAGTCASTTAASGLATLPRRTTTAYSYLFAMRRQFA